MRTTTRSGKTPARNGRPKPAGGAPQEEQAGAASFDDLGFVLFVAYMVLAFTGAFPDQFALPKVLGLFAYTAFCAARWIPALFRGRVNPIPRALGVAALALAAWWVVTTLTAQHVPTALFGMRGRFNGLATMLAGLALFVFLASSRLSAGRVRLRLGAICGALTIAAGYALVQAAGLDSHAWPQGRPPSTLGHPVVLGAVLAMALPLTLVLALEGRSRTARAGWSAAAAIQGLALILTLARGPWAGAACGLAVLAACAAWLRPLLHRRLAAISLAVITLVSAALIAAAPERGRVLERLSTLPRLSTDSSVAYRLHFGRAALAMLRDHPLLGVGWENFGLLYPAYRSAPDAETASDLVPTMVHSGPLQTAVSGGIPALVLQILFFGAVAATVLRRARSDSDGRERLLGAAFAASAIAFLVQDLSGWPHVALDALAFATCGIAVAWSLGDRPHELPRARWPFALLAGAVAAGSAWMCLDAVHRMRAERLVFEAQSLDLRTSWKGAEDRLAAALAVSPDEAWVDDAAAKVYARRTEAAGDRRAYERGIVLASAARKANPFDPYIRLRRAELDLAALNRGLIGGVSDGGRDALAAAKSMTAGSALVEKVEAALDRRASRIVWIEPQATAGFGPRGSLVVGGVARGAVAGSPVFFHWRDVTRGGPWMTESYADVPDADGVWHNAIANARAGDAYEVYSTSQTWSYGPCVYPGGGSVQFCAPLAFLGAAPAGAGPPGGLLVAGAIPESSGQLVLRWRSTSRADGWKFRPFGAVGTAGDVSLPADAPGNWYSVLPAAGPGERFRICLTSPSTAYEACTDGGGGLPAARAPIAWIQPQSLAGFGPPGSLVVGGLLTGARAGAPVFLHWRNVSRATGWTTETTAPVPDARGVWYNAIPDADPAQRYEVSITAPTSASNHCIYPGDGARTVCP